MVLGVTRQRLYTVLGFLAFFGVSHTLQSSTQLQSTVRGFAEYLHANPWKGSAVYVPLSTAVVVSGVPFSLLDMAAAFVYPWPVALAALFVAKTTGSILCFFVARGGLLPVSVRRRALSNDVISKVNNRLTSSPVYYGTLIRFASVPAVAKNYGLALLDISFPAFLCCCLFGSVVFVPIQVVLGKQLGASLGLQGVNAADLPLEQQQQEQAAAIGTTVGIIALILVMRQVVTVVLANEDDTALSARQARDRELLERLASPASPDPTVTPGCGTSHSRAGAVPASQDRRHPRRQDADTASPCWDASDTMDTKDMSGSGPAPAWMGKKKEVEEEEPPVTGTRKKKED